MGLRVHVNRAPQVHLPVVDQNRVAILRDAIDGAVEGPVEDDAGRLALEPRIVLLRELRRGSVTCGRELGTGVGARSGGRASAAPSAAAAARPTLARLDGGDLAQRDESAAFPGWIGHDDLFRRPVAADVRI